MKKVLLIFFMLFCLLISGAFGFDNPNKFLVSWTVVNTWIITCPSQPGAPQSDEYGRKAISNVQTLQLCYDSEVLQKSKYFSTLKEAKYFVNKAKKECKAVYDCGLSDFKISVVKK